MRRAVVNIYKGPVTVYNLAPGMVPGDVQAPLPAVPRGPGRGAKVKKNKKKDKKDKKACQPQKAAGTGTSVFAAARRQKAAEKFGAAAAAAATTTTSLAAAAGLHPDDDVGAGLDVNSQSFMLFFF